MTGKTSRAVSISIRSEFLKKSIFTGFLLAATILKGANGSVYFDTREVDTRVFYVNQDFQLMPAEGDKFFAQLFAASVRNAPESALMALANPVNFRTDANAGFVQTYGETKLGWKVNTTIEIPGLPSQSGEVTLQMRSWSSEFLDYGSASSAFASGNRAAYVGKSTTFGVDKTGGPDGEGGTPLFGRALVGLHSYTMNGPYKLPDIPLGGTVRFDTKLVGAKVFAPLKDGSTVAAEGNKYLAQLYAAPVLGAPSTALRPVGNPVHFGSGAEAGFVQTSGSALGVNVNPIVEVSSIPGGAATVQMWAWSANYNLASAKTEHSRSIPGVTYGSSPTLNLFNTGTSQAETRIDPLPLSGLEGFTMAKPRSFLVGIVNFDTRAVGTKVSVAQPGSEPVAAEGFKYFSQLYGGFGSDAPESSLQPVGNPINFRGGGNVGFVQISGETKLGWDVNPIVVVPAVNGGPATLQMRSWSSDFKNFEEASMAYDKGTPGVAYGKSSTFVVSRTGDPTATPPSTPSDLQGLKPFTMIQRGNQPGGMVRFDNEDLGVKIMVKKSDGSVAAAEGTEFYAQLYAAAGMNAPAGVLAPVGFKVNFQTGANAGFVQTSGLNKDGVTVNPNVVVTSQPGGAATVQIRAWDSNFQSYETALAKLDGGSLTPRIGASALLNIERTGNEFFNSELFTPDLAGLQSFTLGVPEPSSMSLLFSGLGLLCYRVHRRHSR